MPDLQIKITTPAEMTGARAVEQQLERDILKAKLLGKEYEGMEKQLVRVKSVIADAPKSGLLDGLQGFVSGGAAKLAAGFTSVAAAVGVVRNSIEEFGAAEERVIKLDQALSQAGQLTAQYRERLQELAGELQKTTGVADDEWLGVLLRLTQFGSTPQSIGMDVEAVKNLAGIVGSVATAAEIYSKALQGNFESFNRYGIAVAEAGDKTERLEQLQTQLARRGGGQLEASNQTLNGQFRMMRNSVADLFESVGQMIARTGVLQYVLYGLGTTAAWLAEKLGDTIPALAGMRNAAESSIKPLEDAQAAATKYAASQADIARDAKKAADAIRDQVAALREKERANAELTDAELAVTLATIDRDEAGGKLTPDQAIRMRSGARIASAGKKRLLANQADKEEMALLDGQLQGTSAKRQGAAQSVHDLETGVTLLEQYEQLKLVAADAKEKYRNALVEYQDLQETLSRMNADHSDGDPQHGDAVEWRNRVRGQGAVVELARRKSAGAGAEARGARPSLGPDIPGTSAEASARLGLVRDQARKDVEDADEEERRLLEGRGRLQRGIDSRDQIGALHNRAETIKGRTAAEKAFQDALDDQLRAITEGLRANAQKIRESNGQNARASQNSGR